VLRSAEVLETPWLWENGFLDAWEHPRLGPMITVKGYAEFDRTPVTFERPTPDIGEHTAEILAEWGIAPERIASLLAAGAVFASDGCGGVAAPTSAV
jgi:crotonobetainyl-CoA:carnitine CoA-transferase CaiB-like acyl-CoA transferase